MASTTYTKRRKRRKSTETAADALARIEASENPANYPAVVAAFTARGIDADDIKPRENVLTYRAWQAKGRQVRKGEKSVKIDVWIEYDKKSDAGGSQPAPSQPAGDGDKPAKGRARRSVAVFHVSQTDPIEGDPDQLPKSRPAADKPAGDDTPRQSPKSPQPRRKGVTAERLRELADAMEKKIDAKLNPAIARQNWTPRRARIAEGMRYEGYRLQDVQAARRKMADAIDAGTLPAGLVGVYAEGRLMELTRKPEGDFDPIKSEDDRQLRDWLIGGETSEAARKEREEREAEERIRADIMRNPPPGYFPTPTTLGRRMVELADIQPGNEVLEPNGGTGDLAELIVSKMAEVVDAPGDLPSLLLVEINATLCEYLQRMGFAPVQADIMQVRGEVDRVIMNPPYENKQDMRQIRHCYDMLRPGGRLVALASAGVLHRADRESCEFREWLRDDAGCEVLETIEDAFRGPESKRQTGVRVALIVLQKPE